VNRRIPALRTAPWLAVAALTIPLAVTACGGDSSDSSTDVESLRVLDYYNNEPQNSTFQEVIDACGQQAGVTIEREAVPGADLIAKVLQQASSRTLPDVLMLDNPDLQQIASSGALSVVTDYGLSADGYAEGVVDASTYQGELYGLQPVTNTIALFYNEDILAEAGVTPPTTWDELRTAARELTSGDQYGIAFSAPANYEGTWQFLPFMWSNGGDESNIATPEVAGALQLWVDLVDDGSASASVVTWTQADVNDQFRAGNAAMMVNGPWQFPVLNDEAGLNYQVVPIPTPEAGQPVVAPLGGETWTVPNTGDEARQELAAEVVECINSDENQLLLCTELQYVPTKTELQDTFVADQPSMEAFSAMVQTARARTAGLGADWPDAATNIYTAVQSALAGGVPPLEALQNAQDG
jgi:multiple sugar transport system substrate-binding protein